ncbi:hypothetical protein AQJ46_47885 [Streptomyces canus]|uniref:DNA polymerase III beta sliding clamp central domain-containing protein n=1 Tax=Streptomyces canus TaxID=58343 RepID=A0A101RKN2_9ACTN|nr:hypothetical protein [Streptomyces canus]KUN57282.1 hypothetical protein AQJ46_47885 [Streptomyces canus]
MRARVAAGPLRRALRLASLAIRARPEQPAHAGVTLTAQGSKLTVAAYRPYADGGTDVAVTVVVEAEPGGTGRSTLDQRELTRVLDAAVKGDSPAQAARTSIDLKGATIATPDVAVPVRSYITPVTAVPPAAPVVATVAGGEFFRQLTRILPVAAKDETLPILTGVELRMSAGTLRLRASDRHRAAETVMPAQPWDHHEDACAYRALIPSDVLRQMVKFSGTYEGPVAIGLPSETVTTADVLRVPELSVAALEFGPATLTAWRLDGVLPPSWFGPVADGGTLTLHRQDLIRAVRKARAMATAKGAAEQWAQVSLTHSAEEAGVVRVTPRLPQKHERDQTTGTAVPAVCGEQAAPLGGAPLITTGGYLLGALNAFDSDAVTFHLPPQRDGRNHAPFAITAHGEQTEEGHRQHLVPVRRSQD